MQNSHRIAYDEHAIAKYDFDWLLSYLVDKKHWSCQKAQILVVQYRHYMYLRAKYYTNHMLPPSLQIDEIWHNHILHTRKYIEFCNCIFGEYLHHNPSNQHTTSLKIENAFHDTQNLYFKEFGSYIYYIKSWPTFIQIRKMHKAIINYFYSQGGLLFLKLKKFILNTAKR